jgi:hypothetical protein
MYDLEPRPTHRPNRTTRRELEELGQSEITAQRAWEIEGRAVADAEKLRLARSQFRVNGVYDLAEYATHRATMLDRSITAQNRDNPHLEPIHRSFAETASLVANVIIYQYGTGR